jgi:hypothetical protein
MSLQETRRRMAENDPRSAQERGKEKRFKTPLMSDDASDVPFSSKGAPHSSRPTLRICDLSALELKRLCEFPETHELEAAMETLARVAFYVKEDDARLRRILKAIKTLQEMSSE